MFLVPRLGYPGPLEFHQADTKNKTICVHLEVKNFWKQISIMNEDYVAKRILSGYFFLLSCSKLPNNRLWKKCNLSTKIHWWVWSTGSGSENIEEYGQVRQHQNNFKFDLNYKVANIFSCVLGTDVLLLSSIFTLNHCKLLSQEYQSLTLLFEFGSEKY